MDIARAPQKHHGRRIAIGIAALLVAAAAFGVMRLRPADPAVERLSLVIDTVRRGDMLREVRGPGTLVPEQVRWISAVTSARVEKIVAQPGQRVEPDTVLIEMSNPDVQIQALQAEQEYSKAQADFADESVKLRGAWLTQRGAVASVRATQSVAAGESKAAEALVAQQMVSTLELARKRGAADEAGTRLQVEQQRLELMAQAVDQQLAARQRQVDRLRAIATFQRERVESLKVVAGERGVLQELALQPGQWVNGGMTIAKVVQPERLKAVLRIPETLAKDIAVGQSASIDTRNGVIAGHVARIDPAAQAGSVTVDVALDGALPAGARPDLNVDGSILIEELKQVIYTGRPTIGRENSAIRLFRLDPGGDSASLVPVTLGRASAAAVEILGGLQPGDQVVLSDPPLPDGTLHIQLK